MADPKPSRSSTVHSTREAAVAAATGAAQRAKSAASGAQAVRKKATEAASGLGKGSSDHVDLVKNEWLAGYQVVVARVSVKAGRLEVDAHDPAYEEVARRPIGEIDPGRDPVRFLSALAEHVNGSYLFATEPHDHTACPYPQMVVPMESRAEEVRYAEPV